MTPEEDRDIERRLRSLTVKPARPGLREKVLLAAAARRKDAAWTTRGLRWALAACAIALAVICIADSRLDSRRQARLQALLDGSQPAQVQAGDESRVLAELFGEPLDREFAIRSRLAASQKLKEERVRRGEILKGLLEEDLDGWESAKSLH